MHAGERINRRDEAVQNEVGDECERGGMLGDVHWANDGRGTMSAPKLIVSVNRGGASWRWRSVRREHDKKGALTSRRAVRDRNKRAHRGQYVPAPIIRDVLPFTAGAM